MSPARTPRRHLAALATSAAGLALAGASFAAPALADPPAGHPHGQPPGQSDQQPPGAPPEHAAADPDRGDRTPPPAPGPGVPAEERPGSAAERPTAPPARQGDPAGRGEEAPGNAGTVKVHEASTPDDDRRNEPKLCDLRIVGFGFPADAHLEVTIVGHGGPNAGPSTFETEVSNDQLSASGDWAIAGPALEDGMYKLAVENTTAPGGPKQKVFKIDCTDDTSNVDDDVTDGNDMTDGDDVTEGDEDGDDVLSGGTDGDGTAVGPDGDELASGETRVLGAYLEREPAQVLGTDATGGADRLPRTGLELLTLAGGAAALLAGGALAQRGACARR